MRLLSPYLRALARFDEEELTLEDGSTVRDAIVKLSEIHGREILEQLLDERGDLRSGVLLLVNERVAQGAHERLRDGDVVVITIAYEGGGAVKTPRPSRGEVLGASAVTLNSSLNHPLG